MVSFLKKFIKTHYFHKALQEDVQLTFLKRLHRLLDNGYSLIGALEVIKWDKKLANVSEQIIQLLMEGYVIDEAFEKANFHPTIIAYLYFVRINGNLIASIEKCTNMFEQRIKYIKKFSRVIRYPIVLFIVFIFLLIFLKQSVLPLFSDLFQSSTESSRTVLFSIIFIDFISTTFIIVIFLIGIATFIWHFYKRHMSIEEQIAIYNKIPIYRAFLKIQTSYYFATHMSMFLEAGMPIKEILENMSGQQKLPIISHYASLMLEQLQNGVYIDHLLQNLPLLEEQLATLFQKHHNIDSLKKDLTAYAEFLADTLKQKITRAISYIQPAFFITLACFIIFIYLTLMWPMFQLIQTV